LIVPQCFFEKSPSKCIFLKLFLYIKMKWEKYKHTKQIKKYIYERERRKSEKMKIENPVLLVMGGGFLSVLLCL